MLLKHHFSPDTFSPLSCQPRAASAEKKKKKSLSSILFQPGNQAISPQNGGAPLRFSSCVLPRAGFTCVQQQEECSAPPACEISPWGAVPRWPVSGHRLGALWEEGDLPGGIAGELRTARALPANSAPAVGGCAPPAPLAPSSYNDLQTGAELNFKRWELGCFLPHLFLQRGKKKRNPTQPNHTICFMLQLCADNSQHV